MDFELHRKRLVKLIDDILETMEKDPDFTRYHLDGQVLVLSDYLEIRPQNKERLLALIKDGRIKVGPFYILQDAFLTSGEANIRNLTEGLDVCRSLGVEPVKIGYFPDTFGLISQYPQMLKDADINAAAFGRGLINTGADNTVFSAAYGKSEIEWVSPDGSTVDAVVFSNWYCNAMELPCDDKAETVRRMDEIVRNCQRYASTDYLLGMNGCDHQPVQKNLVEAIRQANDFYGKEHVVEIRISDLEEYVQAIRRDKSNFGRIEGEIVGQLTDGMNLLVSTSSSRQPTKNLNFESQRLLENAVEPLTLVNAIEGGAYDADYIRYCWRLLLSNHPHDSICGCDVDDVNSSMLDRYRRLLVLMNQIQRDELQSLADRIDTRNCGDGAIVVFNPRPNRFVGKVKATLLFNEEMPELSVADGDKILPCSVRPKGKRFHYDLPEDSFRKVSYPYEYDVEFYADIDGIGYKTYRVARTAAPEKLFLADESGCETKYLKVNFRSDGTVDVFDKLRNVNYFGLNALEDTGDAGNLYNYKAASGIKVTSDKCEAQVSLLRTDERSATYRVLRVLQVPECLSENGRALQTVPLSVETLVTITDFSSVVEFETTIDNKAKDHRLRALFPTGISADSLFARIPLDRVERYIRPWEGWKNENRLERHCGYVGLRDGARGALIATRALYEYEVPPATPQTIAITLLRCTGNVRDWGDFPAPDGQCLGKTTVRYAFIPFGDKIPTQTAENYVFGGLIAAQTSSHSGDLPQRKTYLKIEGENAVLSAFKRSNDGAAVVRMINLDGAETVCLQSDCEILSAVRSDVLERDKEVVSHSQSSISIEIPKKKIQTLKLRFNEAKGEKR